MAAPRKFDAETRDRAVRMYHEHIADEQCSKVAARKHVGDLLGVNPATPPQLGRGRVHIRACGDVGRVGGAQAP